LKDKELEKKDKKKKDLPERKRPASAYALWCKDQWNEVKTPLFLIFFLGCWWSCTLVLLSRFPIQRKGLHQMGLICVMKFGLVMLMSHCWGTVFISGPRNRVGFEPYRG